MLSVGTTCPNTQDAGRALVGGNGDSLIVRRHFVLNISDQGNAHFGHVIAAQNITDEMCFDGHLYLETCQQVNKVVVMNGDAHHFECSAQDTTEDVGEPQLVLGFAVIRKLNEIGQGVLVEEQRELLVVRCPVGDCGSNVEEDFEADLFIFSY
jgi:hypothetical protein